MPLACPKIFILGRKKKFNFCFKVLESEGWLPLMTGWCLVSKCPSEELPENVPGSP